MHGCTDLVKDEELYNVSSLTSEFVDDPSWSWGSKTKSINYTKIHYKIYRWKLNQIANIIYYI